MYNSACENNGQRNTASDMLLPVTQTDLLVLGL